MSDTDQPTALSAGDELRLLIAERRCVFIRRAVIDEARAAMEEAAMNAYIEASCRESQPEYADPYRVMANRLRAARSALAGGEAVA